VLPVLTVDEMRAADNAAIAALGDKARSSGSDYDVFIQRAGAACARAAMQMMGGAYGKRVIVIAGKGHNGDDGRVAAAHLRERGASVTICDAAEMDNVFIDERNADIVIDAAYGIGFRGTWNPPVVFDVPVLAVDVPSGLNANTGIAEGPVLPADRTLAFGALKRGMLFHDGPQLCGHVEVHDVGIDAMAHLDNIGVYLMEASDAMHWLPHREHDAHKWTHSLRVVAGSAGMTGAAALVCASAMRAGVGIVHSSMRDGDAMAQLALPTEVVHRALPATNWAAAITSDIHRFDAMVIGPGLGRGDDVATEVRSVLAATTLPTVIDGDGLGASVDAHGDVSTLSSRDGITVLTPHDGEFSALGGNAHDIDRIATTQEVARTTNATVLRKGPTTVVAPPQGPVFLVASGDNRLATAGTGDVLSGVIGAFLARGMEGSTAAAAGAMVHGLAGAICMSDGTIARDVVSGVGEVLSDMNKTMNDVVHRENTQ
jgi:ADP-dependent NAD(P)H-hydrate dehydratase / NAD(P)H-hydrate epimerase